MLKMKQRYLDLEAGHKLESHAETVYCFQGQSDDVLIGVALMNLCATYGANTVRRTISAQMGMRVPVKKQTKKVA